MKSNFYGWFIYCLVWSISKVVALEKEFCELQISVLKKIRLKVSFDFANKITKETYLAFALNKYLPKF